MIFRMIKLIIISKYNLFPQYAAYIYQSNRNGMCFRSMTNLEHAHGTACLTYNKNKVTVKNRALR